AGEKQLRNLAHVAVFIGRIDHAVARNGVAASNTRRAAVEASLGKEVAVQLRCLVKVKSYRLSVWYCER
ncbi:MAG: hypothetical protein J0653_02370, partial [Deltaproteobacteria bacterium]|nr:hypothetical protein [Deltaproteobacteria bacterium]